MKLSICYISFLIVLVSSEKIVFAQQKPYSIEWSRSYGGSRDENHGGISRQHNSLLPTSDGGYIFAGVTTSIDGDVDKTRRRDDTFVRDSCKNEDIWIVKLASDNTIEWEQYYGGEGTDIIGSITATSNGGFIVCGETSSISGDFPFDTTGNIDVYIKGGVADGFVMKLDSLGRKLWISRIGGTKIDGLHRVIETSDNGFLACGYTYSTDESWQGLSWIRNSGPWADGFIVKLGADGTKKWSKRYGGTMLDPIYDLIEKPEGGYILLGSTNSEDGDVSKLHYKDTVNSLGPTFDIWLLEISSTGTILRDHCFSGSETDEGIVIAHSVNSGYVITGNTYSNNADVRGYHSEKKGLGYAPFDAWIFKIDSAWNIVWQNCIGGSQQDHFTSLIPTRSGGYAFTGYTNSSDGDLTGIHNPLPEHNWDIWAGELSSTGKLLWHQCFGGTGNDYGNGIVENPDGELTLYATVGSMDGDVVGHHGGIYPHFSDIWVAKLQKKQNSVESSSGGSHFANPFPNPSSDQMSVYIHPTEPVERVQFFNPLGQEFYPHYRIDGNLLTAVVNGLPGGIYVIRITYKNIEAQEIRKFVKVE